MLYFRYLALCCKTFLAVRDVNVSLHFISIPSTAPSRPWPPSEDPSILLCLLLVSSILVFPRSVMCPLHDIFPSCSYVLTGLVLFLIRQLESQI